MKETNHSVSSDLVEVVRDKEQRVICFIIRSNYSPDNTEFFTPDNYSQQLGIIKYNIGGKIKPHIHKKVKREVHYTQEVLVIRKGKVKVSLYGINLEFVCERVLMIGDTILLAAGGHGFEMMEDSEMLEIKQGPYSGVESDKTHF